MTGNPMSLSTRLTELAKMAKAPTPVVSVYLNTRWTDEHQRDRVRVFLKNELGTARRARAGRAADADLDWIEAQGAALVSQAVDADAVGVALFACEAVGLRERLPVRIAFDDAFVVADTPHLRPLAGLLEAAPAAVVVFVDTESARLIALTPEGVGDEVRLESEVPGHHRRGGWAQLAQSHYQRHVQDHRARHFDAVAESLAGLAESEHVRIVLAGDTRNVAVFREALAPRLAERIVGTVAGARHESGAVIAGRAVELLGHHQAQRAADDLSAVLRSAAKGGRATAGLDRTLEAVNRGAVHCLYLAQGFREPGRFCAGCGTLQRGVASACAVCGGETAPRELGEAMTDRVVGAGGTVETVAPDQELAERGGVAARLRYLL
jgi:peptide subunit release factor 1 (eRF1)